MPSAAAALRRPPSSAALDEDGDGPQFVDSHRDSALDCQALELSIHQELTSYSDANANPILHRIPASEEETQMKQFAAAALALSMLSPAFAAEPELQISACRHSRGEALRRRRTSPAASKLRCSTRQPESTARRRGR